MGQKSYFFILCVHETTNFENTPNAEGIHWQLLIYRSPNFDIVAKKLYFIFLIKSLDQGVILNSLVKIFLKPPLIYEEDDRVRKR